MRALNPPHYNKKISKLKLVKKNKKEIIHLSIFTSMIEGGNYYGGKI